MHTSHADPKKVPIEHCTRCRGMINMLRGDYVQVGKVESNSFVERFTPAVTICKSCLEKSPIRA